MSTPSLIVDFTKTHVRRHNGDVLLGGNRGIEVARAISNDGSRTHAVSSFSLLRDTFVLRASQLPHLILRAAQYQVPRQ